MTDEGSRLTDTHGITENRKRKMKSHVGRSRRTPQSQIIQQLRVRMKFFPKAPSSQGKKGKRKQESHCLI